MNKHQQIAMLHCVTLAMTKQENDFSLSPDLPTGRQVEAVSSQRSAEIEPKAGITFQIQKGNSLQKKEKFL